MKFFDFSFYSFANINFLNKKKKKRKKRKETKNLTIFNIMCYVYYFVKLQFDEMQPKLQILLAQMEKQSTRIDYANDDKRSSKGVNGSFRVRR